MAAAQTDYCLLSFRRILSMPVNRFPPDKTILPAFGTTGPWLSHPPEPGVHDAGSHNSDIVTPDYDEAVPSDISGRPAKCPPQISQKKSSGPLPLFSKKNNQTKCCVPATVILP